MARGGWAIYHIIISNVLKKTNRKQGTSDNHWGDEGSVYLSFPFFSLLSLFRSTCLNSSRSLNWVKICEFNSPYNFYNTKKKKKKKEGEKKEPFCLTSVPLITASWSQTLLQAASSPLSPLHHYTYYSLHLRPSAQASQSPHIRATINKSQPNTESKKKKIKQFTASSTVSVRATKIS